MNWLAHLLLSEPTPAARLGGVLPDMAPPAALSGLNAEFQRGMQRHWQIDAFTDAHPVFRRSVWRFSPPLRRFGGIVTDLFYDHFLTRHWDIYSAQPLTDFIEEVHASVADHCDDLPEPASSRLQRMCRERWLANYGSLDGLRVTLARVSRRFRRPVNLVPAVAVLEKEYAAFETDFADFFPELWRHPPPSLRGQSDSFLCL